MASTEPLWRAIAVYRFASIGYAVMALAASVGAAVYGSRLRRPAVLGQSAVARMPYRK